MKSRTQSQVLIVSRRTIKDKVSLRGSLRHAARVRVKSVKQALRKGRDEHVAGIVVDMDFREKGMDGLELALLLGDLQRRIPIWVAAPRGLLKRLSHQKGD